MVEPSTTSRDLPPGQREVERPPVHHVGEPLAFDAATWRLALGGAVEVVREFTWSDVIALPRAELEADWHGGAGWSVRAVRWSGVSLAPLLHAARPQANARFVRFSDGALYDTTLPLESVLHSDVLLATSLAGEPLNARHGAPLRLVVASKYAWKSVKWLRRIELLADDVPGFWERRGWHTAADPWRAERLA
jgi:DMSO/TMAO reductase YedYZ molybdopterin-dependent catalytic subunit